MKKNYAKVASLYISIGLILSGFIACGGSSSSTDTTAPSVPTNVAATAGSTTSINLTWNAASDNVAVTGYKVYVGTTELTSITTTSYRLTGLTANTQYCYTVKAFDVAGNLSATSVQACTTTLTSVTYSGKEYHLVRIGSQTWLQENLDVGTMIQGSTNSTNNGTIEKYCYGNDPANCNKYGGLYQWDEAMMYTTTSGAQGACPVGWHIPTPTEFQTLSATAGNDLNAFLSIGQANGTNITEFSGLFAGFGSPFIIITATGSNFDKLNIGTRFWSSSVIITDVYHWVIDSTITTNASDRRYAYSIRCIMN